MKIILCLDNKNGLLFNERRQSRDSEIQKRILELVSGKKLWTNSYSAELFKDRSNLHISDDFLDKAGDEDYCFVENEMIPMSEVTEVVIYKWNRRYPADTFFDFNFKEHGFRKVSTYDFSGSSHEKITEEIYIKKELSK